MRQQSLHTYPMTTAGETTDRGRPIWLFDGVRCDPPRSAKSSQLVKRIDDTTSEIEAQAWMCHGRKMLKGWPVIGVHHATKSQQQ